MVDENSLSIITGYNEAGKSSIAGAIEFVMSGGAFGHRGKDVDALITTGEDRMQVRLTTGNFSWNRTKSGGDKIEGIADDLGTHKDILPILFNHKLCGDGGSKAIKTFLDTAATARFDPFAAFTDEPDVRSCIEHAKRAGQTTTQQIARFAEQQRAASKAPPEPVKPTSIAPTELELKLARQKVEELRAKHAAAKADLEQLDVTSQGVAAVLSFLKASEAHENLKRTASLVDNLPNRDAHQKVINVNIESMGAVVEILEAAGYKKPGGYDVLTAIGVVKSCIATSSKLLADNPSPNKLPDEPTLSDDGLKILPSLEKSGDDSPEKLRALLTNSAAMRPELAQAVTDADSEMTNAKLKLESLLRVQGAWQQYDVSFPQWEDNKVQSETAWNRWDNCVKRLKVVEDAHLAKAGDAFGLLVSSFADELLQGRKLTISRENGIMLNGMPLGEDTSVSTTWRVEVCIMAAIARTLKSPLLVIDAADILDERNKNAFLSWLLNKIVPYFGHVIITSTCRAKLEDEKPSPSGTTKWLLNNGELTKLVA
jgi:hypothetical protein